MDEIRLAVIREMCQPADVSTKEIGSPGPDRARISSRWSPTDRDEGSPGGLGR